MLCAADTETFANLVRARADVMAVDSVRTARPRRWRGFSCDPWSAKADDTALHYAARINAASAAHVLIDHVKAISAVCVRRCEVNLRMQLTSLGRTAPPPPLRTKSEHAPASCSLAQPRPSYGHLAWCRLARKAVTRFVNMRNKLKDTALHVAARCGALAVAQYLVDEGHARVQTQNQARAGASPGRACVTAVARQDGCTALIEAARSSWSVETTIETLARIEVGRRRQFAHSVIIAEPRFRAAGSDARVPRGAGPHAGAHRPAQRHHGQVGMCRAPLCAQRTRADLLACRAGGRPLPAPAGRSPRCRWSRVASCACGSSRSKWTSSSTLATSSTCVHALLAGVCRLDSSR